MSTSHTFLKSLSATLLALCGACTQPGGTTTTSTSSSSGQAVSSSSEGTGSSSSSGGAAECIHIRAQDLDPVVLDVKDDVSTTYSMRFKVNLGTPVNDYFVLKFFNYNERLETPTGTFPLGEGMNANTGTCAECLNIFVDQLNPNSAPTKLLFQSEGAINLTSDPRDLTLRGSVTGLKLVEVTLDQMTLESQPVPGGLCITVDELTWDYHYVADGWTCDPASYNGGDDCDCGCGAFDPDCSNLFEEPAPIRGCAADEQCVLERCMKTCSTMDPVESCASGVCILGSPQDVCEPNLDVVDPAPLGATCMSPPPTFVCGVVNGIERGACDVEDRTCRPVCAEHADCATGQHCAQLVFGWDLSWKGYCRAGAPYEWQQCEPEKFHDGTTCDCGCGAVDPDCADTSLPRVGCDGGM